MKRNWYAVCLLLLLAVTLYSAGRFMNSSTQILQNELDAAYDKATTGDYCEASQLFRGIVLQSEEYSRLWLLLVRRSLVDQLNQTLATIPSYVSEENLADLAVETARAHAQVKQIGQSFFSWF